MLANELEGYEGYKRKVKYRLIPYIWWIAGRQDRKLKNIYTFGLTAGRLMAKINKDG